MRTIYSLAGVITMILATLRGGISGLIGNRVRAAAHRELARQMRRLMR